MFADRLEVENPGGLYGRVTIDKLQEGQSTRNRLLMHLMEDVHLVENRGSGIDAMQKRGLPASVFEDKRTSFLVKFYQVMTAELSEEEQRVLSYVKEHGSIKRAEAQKLLEVSDRRAKYVLEKMEKARLLRQEGQHKSARYLLP
jgi:predicted HTH transcriptional regulator